MPLITVQIMGAVSILKSTVTAPTRDFVGEFSDDEIIELWEVT